MLSVTSFLVASVIVLRDFVLTKIRPISGAFFSLISANVLMTWTCSIKRERQVGELYLHLTHTHTDIL